MKNQNRICLTSPRRRQFLRRGEAPSKVLKFTELPLCLPLRPILRFSTLHLGNKLHRALSYSGALLSSEILQFWVKTAKFCLYLLKESILTWNTKSRELRTNSGKNALESNWNPTKRSYKNCIIYGLSTTPKLKRCSSPSIQYKTNENKDNNEKQNLKTCKQTEKPQ